MENELLSALLEKLNMPLAMHELVFDDDGNAKAYKYLYVNDNYAKLCNLDKENITGKLFSEVFNVEPLIWYNNFSKIAINNGSCKFEVFFDPLEKYFEINAYSIENHKFAVIFNDITDKVNKIVSLKLINNEFENYYENAPDIFLSVSMDNGKIVRCNRRFVEKFAMEKKDIAGRQFSDFLTQSSIKSYYSILIDLHTERLVKNREIILKNFDGDLFTMSLNAITDTSDSKSQKCFLSLRDITQQKKIESALEFAEKRLVSLVEAVDDMMYFQNLNGEISYLNKAIESITGYSIEEFKKDPLLWQKIVNPEDLQIAMSFFKNFPNGTDFFDVEYSLRSKSGKTVYLYSKMIGVKDTSGNFIGYYCIDRDVSYFKEIQNEINLAREKAEEANNLKTIILNNLGHELRTPLNGILGFAQILIHELQDPDFLEMAGFIKESGIRLERTLNSLLALSELETQTKNAYLEKVLVGDFIKAYCSSFEEGFIRKGLYFRIEIRDESITALMDENLTMQILFNLLDNALKYTSVGGVTIELKNQEHNNKEWIAIIVADTGPGISQKHIKSVFEAFRQESEGISRMHEGLGIGLTLTKKMVELQNAELIVESEVDKGTKISVLFQKG